MTWLWCGYSQPLFFASGSYCRHVAQLIFCETYGSTMKGRVQWLFVISGILIHVVTRVWILLVGGSRLQSEYMGVVLPNKKVLFIWLLFFFSLDENLYLFIYLSFLCPMVGAYPRGWTMLTRWVLQKAPCDGIIMVAA